MARLTLDGPHLTVRLSPLERLGALSSDVRVPLSNVAGVRVADRPWAEVRGLRIGTGIPFVILLGRMLSFEGMDFVAIYGRRPTVVVDLSPGQRYRRLLVSGADERVLDALRRSVPVSATA